MKSLNSCNEDLKKTFYKKIVVAGGNTLFEGLISRFKNEVLQ